jgi:hypothetical protein
MKLILNSLVYIGILLSLMQNHYYIAAILIFVFTMRANAGWLIVIALLVDGFYGAFYASPNITLLAVFWYILSESLKPRVFAFKGTYEKVA